MLQGLLLAEALNQKEPKNEYTNANTDSWKADRTNAKLRNTSCTVLDYKRLQRPRANFAGSSAPTCAAEEGEVLRTHRKELGNE